jgi:hypothetical protein
VRDVERLQVCQDANEHRDQGDGGDERRADHAPQGRLPTRASANIAIRSLWLYTSLITNRLQNLGPMTRSMYMFIH